MTWVGASVPRQEDRRMLLGRGRFTGDMPAAGLLHAAFVRSPFAAAEVRAIDLSAALAAPGTRAAFTAADLGDPVLLAVLERPEFVPDRMPAAGRSARSGTWASRSPWSWPIRPYTAEDAAELVDVYYGEHPAVASRRGGAQRVPAGARGRAGNVLVDLTMFDDDRLDGHLRRRPRGEQAGLSQRRGWPRHRWRAAPASRPSTSGPGRSSCTCRPRSRTRCGPRWPCPSDGRTSRCG